MKRVSQWCLMLVVLIFVTSCRQNGEETPTAIAPATTTVIEFVPTDTPTATPPPVLEETATHTAVPEPTSTIPPTAVPSVEPTLTAVSQPTDLIIHQPGMSTELPVGQEITINGDVLPPQVAEVEVRLSLAGNEILLSETAVADANGRWQLTAVIPPQIAGPAEVEARIVDTDLSRVNQITLVSMGGEEQTTISISKPLAMETAVVGYTLFFEGLVNNPINETITIAVLDQDCTNVAASQSFTVPGGAWFGFTIVSNLAEPGLACAVAYTGERGAEDGREYRVPLNLVSADDPAATILELGNGQEIPFQAGQSTYLFGVAINTPENQVNIRLEADDPSRPSGIITSATAFANQYGFWEIDLEIPEDASGSALLYVTSGNNDDNYREIRLPVGVQE